MESNRNVNEMRESMNTWKDGENYSHGAMMSKSTRDVQLRTIMKALQTEIGYCENMYG